MQVNITIPDEWKIKLDKIARKVAYEEDRDYSYLDVIRDSIKNHCNILDHDLIEKNKNDIIGYIENLKIINRFGLVDFKLHDYQKRYIDFIEKNRYGITCKFRQGGFSTLNSAWALWKCTHFPDKKVVFVSGRDSEAISINMIIQKMIEHLPLEIKPNVTKRNDHTIEFDNKSAIFSIDINNLFPYRYKISNLFIEEAAFMDKIESSWKRVFPFIDKCIVTSTTNGINNWFYDVYDDAKSGLNSFKIFECSYLEHPDYQNSEYLANMRKNLGEEGFSQEIECKFHGI